MRLRGFEPYSLDHFTFFNDLSTFLYLLVALERGRAPKILIRRGELVLSGATKKIKKVEDHSQLEGSKPRKRV